MVLYGCTTGSYDHYLKLNSIFYEVEIPDSQVKEYSTNIVAQNMLTKMYYEGLSMMRRKSIADYKKDDSALDKKDKYVVTRRNKFQLRNTTQGWKLLIIRKDGSKS